MLSYEDCLGLCGLTEDEIDAIAEHEHLPLIVAAEYATYLCRAADGEARIRRIILDDIEAAKSRGDRRHALALKLVLRRFIESHEREGGHKAAKPATSTPV